MVKFASRKFWLAVVYSAVVVLLRIFNLVDVENFSHMLMAFFAVYCGSNVVSKFTK